MSILFFFFSSRRRHTRFDCDWSSDVCSSDLFLASDGDLMEGISHEACSLAGHLKLGKLIGIYDDNHITIDGDTSLAFSDDTAKRFEAYGWHVQRVADGNDVSTLDPALAAARRPTERPSLVNVRTHIAFGSPGYQDTAEAHGAPLGA